ncbi:PREDICTED: retinol dehydrogenase 2-like [Branchiostoma belcheri]|uniref:Retinol dehydrogenase 2-like n=1 Tax=Branchiostoma belcheri TaxID=7741 RepID=A0A6P4YHN1_BRABE|nr:PREDICTED: retinol dehydrogenase 2-like [Branchiostoma belcheri]XP_019623938.1 PREDICTED: retinol dehydrogenase 2-like [Branchiostoma belcheri]XP_019623940.1 PREDICTED: retinol dehydrogenase 2-like [Branchiostoma belcheri]
MLDSLLFVILLIIGYKIYKWVKGRPRIPRTSDKSVLITGCDSGFGREDAIRLDGLGFRVFAACLTEKGEVEIRKSCSERVVTLRINVANHESVKQGLQTVRDHVGDKGLWGLVNNAGISGRIGHMDWLDLQDYRQVFDINFFGLVDVTYTFLPLLKKAGGRIVNMSSCTARMEPGTGPYAASKFAVEGFSDGFRRTLKSAGVSVHIIEPGYFKTAITKAENVAEKMKALWDSLDPEKKEEKGEEYFQARTEDVLKHLDLICSPRLDLVVDAIEHALTAVSPHSRYVCGWDAKLFFIPVSWLPTDIGDAIFAWATPK